MVPGTGFFLKKCLLFCCSALFIQQLGSVEMWHGVDWLVMGRPGLEWSPGETGVLVTTKETETME